ncbi:O-antigen ligase [uncultured Ruminococcus sp.]|uniref:O-antigen ligase family protein n=1 Tax=uncultured Ruminococcus sp. TaxID=165186 RepID=UPI0026034F8D|nr:O-antigen ligase family protein [uncultured Ruminococcus sp.]
MKKYTEQFQAIYRSKTVPEMLRNISWEMVAYLALLPLLLFTAAPLYQLIRDSIDPPQSTHFMMDTPSFSYSYTVNTISTIAAVVGILVILLYIGKTRQLHWQWRDLVRRNVPMVFFAAFVVCMIVSTCLNGFTQAALSGDPYRNESLFTYILYVLIYFFCGAVIFQPKCKCILMYGFMGVSLVIAASALVHAWMIPLPAYSQNAGLSAVFHQFNHYGYYLLFSILLSSALFVTEKNPSRKALCLFVFLINNVVLVVNDTFGCYLAVFIALLFQCMVFWIKDKRFSWLSLLLLGCFLGVSLVMSIWYDTVFHNVFGFFQDISNVAENPDDSGSAGTGRWTLWVHTLQYISEKPLFGFGVEGIHDRLDLETNHCNNRPHNEYLQYAAFFGIPAAILYVCGLASVYIHSWKYRAKLDGYSIAALIAAFGYLISACFGNTMYYTTPWLFLFLGFGCSITCLAPEQQKQESP